ncbi:MAG: DUF4189 domain-containing protein [Sphingomonadales bacterium]|nr:DUF4189 domain-containing protein [Sphingomonadales bacterium]
MKLYKHGGLAAVATAGTGVAALGAGMLALTSAPVSAQQCTSDSSDNRGCAVIVPGPNLMAQWERDAAARNVPPAPPRPAPYLAIAVHPEANDYWIAAMYPDAYSAMYAARNKCNEVMGGGCNAIWQGSGYIGAARTVNGEVLWIVDQNKGKIKSQLGDWCKSYQLGCIDTSIYHANSEFRKNRSKTGPNIRGPNDLATVRNQYAAVSWLAGDAYDGRGWIASGYASAKQAQDVAMNSCKLRSNNNKPCGVGITTGNGVVIAFKTSDGERFLAERDEARARKAVDIYCKQEKLTCKVHYVYDARSRGTFENIIP